MTVRDTIGKLRDALAPIYGKGEADAMIRIMFHHLKGWSLTDMLVHGEDELSPFISGEADKILVRLLNHEPIQYITGEVRFHGLELKVTPDVLIPRPETSELVDLIADRAGEREDLRVLDICTGSGCIAVALARTLRFPHVTATDISEAALKVAKENSDRLRTGVQFIRADVFGWEPEGTWDIIVSNPPYICESEKEGMEDNVLLHEPHQALFVPDDDPLVFYRRIAAIAATHLTPGGSLWLEINPLQAAGVKGCLESNGLADVEIIRDSYGKERFATARKE